jgi:hypothetical protein
VCVCVCVCVGGWGWVPECLLIKSTLAYQGGPQNTIIIKTRRVRITCTPLSRIKMLLDHLQPILFVIISYTMTQREYY